MIPRLFIFITLLGLGEASAADAKAPAIVVPTPAVVSPVTAAPRNDSAVAPASTFDTFRLISDRNIFNPNRTGRRDRNTEERAPRTDTISFVGTMDYEKGLLAFFDGSDATYRKTLHVGESVAQFKVTKISADTVELERDGKTFAMHMGQQFRRPEGADWNLIGADVVRNEAQAAKAAEAAAAAAGSAPPPIPADASEALRRLMEQRQKQLKQ